MIRNILDVCIDNVYGVYNKTRFACLVVGSVFVLFGIADLLGLLTTYEGSEITTNADARKHGLKMISFGLINLLVRFTLMKKKKIYS
ncbi:MAG: hypothetical protein HOI47_19620 [Candidatus Scalindua sp.]|jgi:hypothetical protein|nr:hypothetical protein [Candidatus Scalindua sp.]MBT6228857.1 hypothetical protein [Candidatus Scalindua sp.]